MNRVILAGRLASAPLPSTVSGLAVVLLKLLVLRRPVACDCPELDAEVDCFAFDEVAGYLATYGKPGGWLSLDGRLSQDRFVYPDGRAQYRLCVHIDRAQLFTPLRLPAGPPPGQPAASSPASPPNGKEPAP